MAYDPNDVRTWPIVAGPDTGAQQPEPAPAPAAEHEDAPSGRLWMVGALALAVMVGAATGVYVVKDRQSSQAMDPSIAESSPAASPTTTEVLIPSATASQATVSEASLGESFTLPAELTRFSTSYVAVDSSTPTRWVSFLQKSGEAYKTLPTTFPGILQGVATTSLSGLGNPDVMKYDSVLSEENKEATFTIDRGGLWIDLDRQGVTTNSVNIQNKASTETMLEQEFGDKNVRHRDARRLIELQRSHASKIADLNTFFFKKQVTKREVGNEILAQAEAVAKMLLESAAEIDGITKDKIEFVFTGDWSPGVWDFIEKDKPALARQDDFRYKPEKAYWDIQISPAYEGVES